jgi:Aldo/keto reductase family
MEYSLFSRDAEEQGQIDACKELGMAMMAYAVLGRGMLSDQVPKVEELAADDVRRSLPRFQSVNIGKNLGLRSALEAIARRKKRHALPALHRLANGPGKACGSLHRPDTRREIAQAPRGERARRGHCADGRVSCGNRPHRPVRCRVRYSLSDKTNAPTERVACRSNPRLLSNNARSRIDAMGRQRWSGDVRAAAAFPSMTAIMLCPANDARCHDEWPGRALLDGVLIAKNERAASMY